MVSDGSLPYGRRINALAGCVERYRPLGYLATFGYLNEVAGPFRSEEAALLRALAALTASRTLWLTELGSYASRRKEAKQLGRRTPRSSDSDPSQLTCWYGDSRRAATFTLGFLLRKRDRIACADADVIRLASAVLEAGGDVDRVWLDQLSVLRKRLKLLREVSGRPNVDWPNWHKANQSLPDLSRRNFPRSSTGRRRDQSASSPSRCATAAASTRLATSSLAMIRETWTLAVLGEM
ncbi:hypothetical protein [Actinoplanes sp. NPDC051411]|uniref:hypothetical protein n=1 Tax=Actinoplanes sp. NPDC051411 TaxID=3155522 RepID=UPI00341BC32F